jgi:hypothetical protein
MYKFLLNFVNLSQTRLSKKFINTTYNIIRMVINSKKYNNRIPSI